MRPRFTPRTGTPAASTSSTVRSIVPSPPRLTANSSVVAVGNGACPARPRGARSPRGRGSPTTWLAVLASCHAAGRSGWTTRRMDAMTPSLRPRCQDATRSEGASASALGLGVCCRRLWRRLFRGRLLGRRSSWPERPSAGDGLLGGAAFLAAGAFLRGRPSWRGPSGRRTGAFLAAVLLRGRLAPRRLLRGLHRSAGDVHHRSGGLRRTLDELLDDLDHVLVRRQVELLDLVADLSCARGRRAARRSGGPARPAPLPSPRRARAQPRPLWRDRARSPRGSGGSPR